MSNFLSNLWNYIFPTSESPKSCLGKEKEIQEYRDKANAFRKQGKLKLAEKNDSIASDLAFKYHNESKPQNVVDLHWYNFCFSTSSSPKVFIFLCLSFFITLKLI